MKKLTFTLLLSSLSLLAKDTAVDRLNTASDVFSEIMQTSDKSVPQDLLDRAKCIVVVPGLKKAGFILGAQFGKGFMTCRTSKGLSGPAAIRIEGGSVGAQIGAGETDLILVVMNDTGAKKLMSSQFAIGGEGDVMAGPVGRSAQANTDASFHAEMLAYSRSRGLFAGIALKGSTLRQDLGENEELYGSKATNKDILMGRVAAPASASDYDKKLTRYFRIHPPSTAPLRRTSRR